MNKAQSARVATDKGDAKGFDLGGYLLPVESRACRRNSHRVWTASQLKHWSRLQIKP